jgi:hypothetical protein
MLLAFVCLTGLLSVIIVSVCVARRARYQKDQVELSKFLRSYRVEKLARFAQSIGFKFGRDGEDSIVLPRRFFFRYEAGLAEQLLTLIYRGDLLEGKLNLEEIARELSYSSLDYQQAVLARIKEVNCQLAAMMEPLLEGQHWQRFKEQSSCL